MYFASFKTTFKDDTADAVDCIVYVACYTVRMTGVRCGEAAMQPWLAQCDRGRSGPCAGLHPAAGLRPACGRGSLPAAVPYIREMVEASAFLADGRLSMERGSAMLKAGHTAPPSKSAKACAGGLS